MFVTHALVKDAEIRAFQAEEDRLKMKETLQIIASGSEVHSVVSDAQIAQLQKLSGIPLPPTQLTYHARLAPTGEGDLAFTWADKPHRVIYDLCARIELAGEALRDLDNG